MEIYRENGFLGYYAGLIPRLIANVSVLILASASTYILNNYVVHEQAMKAYTASTMKVSEFNGFSKVFRCIFTYIRYIYS